MKYLLLATLGLLPAAFGSNVAKLFPSEKTSCLDPGTGRNILLTTDHKMRPDHTHPIFSPDSKRVLIQSGHRSDGKHLDLMTVEVPAGP